MSLILGIEMKTAGILLATAVLGSIPIWSCGLRKNLTFWQFLVEHTRFGHPVMYVPEELYTHPLSEEEIEKLLALREAERILQIETGKEEE